MEPLAPAGSANIDRDDALFERAELWPVRLTFLTASGLTLWGPARIEDGPDRVLTFDGDLVLAGSEPTLRTFIATRENSMVGLPGYQFLRQRVREGGARLDEQVGFDYRAVAQALDWPTEQWDLDAVVGLVNALNMLGDVADELQDEELIAQMDSPEYLAILERLTFLSESEVPDAVAALDRPFLRLLVGMGIDHIERRIVLV
jgi:hypothetical protein